MSTHNIMFSWTNKKNDCLFTSLILNLSLFVCIEVLHPNQPNGVMSSAVSLPINHTFTGQS